MTDLERNERISEELNRISIYFENLPENKKSMVTPLLQNASFMRVALDDLQQIIAEQGPVEAYKNGENQFGMKQSAALQSYNSLVKNYASVIKSLFNLLPPMERPEWKQPEKTEEEIEAEQREQEELEARRKREVDGAIAYQKWQREQEAAGLRPNVSFEMWLRQWMLEHNEGG